MAFLPLKDATLCLQKRFPNMTRDALRSRGDRGTWNCTIGPDGKRRYEVPDDLAMASESPVPEDTDFEDTAPDRPARHGDPYEYVPHDDVGGFMSVEDGTVEFMCAPKGHVYKWFGLFDVHVPFHDKPTWRAMLKCLRDEQPDEIIIVGDFMDMLSMSAHAPHSADRLMLSQELAPGKKALKQLRDTAPEAVITYIEGNHETRPKRLATKVLPQIADMMDIDRLLGLSDMGIQFVSESQRALRRGHLRFVHGKWTNDHHAKKHMTKYNWPGTVYGHTHRPQMYSHADGDDRIRVAYGMPCMCEIPPDWAAGEPTGWINGFGIGYVDDRGDFSVYPVLSFGGRFRWNGKVYDGNY